MKLIEVANKSQRLYSFICVAEYILMDGILFAMYPGNENKKTKRKKNKTKQIEDCKMLLEKVRLLSLLFLYLWRDLMIMLIVSLEKRIALQQRQRRVYNYLIFLVFKLFDHFPKNLLSFLQGRYIDAIFSNSPLTNRWERRNSINLF